MNQLDNPTLSKCFFSASIYPISESRLRIFSGSTVSYTFDHFNISSCNIFREIRRIFVSLPIMNFHLLDLSEFCSLLQQAFDDRSKKDGICTIRLDLLVVVSTVHVNCTYWLAGMYCDLASMVVGLHSTRLGA
jgi:hypothetical protein